MPGPPRCWSETRSGHAGCACLLATGHLNPQLLLQLQSLAHDGHKTKAVRLLRQSTRSDLKTAKNYVDRL